MTSRKQAIAIALNEAGASKYQSKERKRKSLAESQREQAELRTYQQEAESNSHVGASGLRESSPAMGGEDAVGPTTGGATKQALYARARAKRIEGRSKMIEPWASRAAGEDVG